MSITFHRNKQLSWPDFQSESLGLFKLFNLFGTITDMMSILNELTFSELIICWAITSPFASLRMTSVLCFSSVTSIHKFLVGRSNEETGFKCCFSRRTPLTKNSSKSVLKTLITSCNNHILFGGTSPV